MILSQFHLLSVIITSFIRNHLSNFITQWTDTNDPTPSISKLAIWQVLQPLPYIQISKLGLSLIKNHTIKYFAGEDVQVHIFLAVAPDRCRGELTLRLLISYIYGAPSKARNANVVYIWTYVWQRWNNLFLFAAQCFNTESMQRGFLCHICV